MSTLTPNMERRVTRKTLAGAPAPGFAGPGHTAVEVVASTALADTDPFVILADDTLDFRPGQPVGEAHPHAGLETVTLMLEGSLSDKEEGLLEESDLAWMTAGRGLVHKRTSRLRAGPGSSNSGSHLQVGTVTRPPTCRYFHCQAFLFGARRASKHGSTAAAVEAPFQQRETASR